MPSFHFFCYISSGNRFQIAISNQEVVKKLVCEVSSLDSSIPILQIRGRLVICNIVGQLLNA